MLYPNSSQKKMMKWNNKCRCPKSLLIYYNKPPQNCWLREIVSEKFNIHKKCNAAVLLEDLKEKRLKRHVLN